MHKWCPILGGEGGSSKIGQNMTKWKKGEKTINLFKFLRKLITLCTNLVFLAQVYVHEEKWYTQVEEKNIYIEPHFEAEKMLTHSISIPLNFIAVRHFVKASHGLC